MSGRAVPTDVNVTSSRKPAPARACDQINDEGPERMSQVPRAPSGSARFTRVFARPKLIDSGIRRKGRWGQLHGVFFFLTSTLLPITPPRIPPAAAPMTPPFTLSRLVVAPMIAPAAAPIAASRFVFF